MLLLVRINSMTGLATGRIAKEQLRRDAFRPGNAMLR
jgi:hypothetical protein